MTDDGLGFTTGDGSVWFTDGSRAQRIGRAIGAQDYMQAAVAVDSGNAGSLLAWTEPGRRVELVVYDTYEGREVSRTAIHGCETTCTPRVVGDHVYWGPVGRAHRTMLDVATGRSLGVTARDYASDVADQHRALIVGESPAVGEITDAIDWGFEVKGSQLLPMREGPLESMPPGYGLEPQPTAHAFRSSTHAPVRLRMPEGYDGAAEFTAFQWLDDDRLALMALAHSVGVNGPAGMSDILVCRISTGQCRLAVPGPGPGTIRTVPDLELPG